MEILPADKKFLGLWVLGCWQRNLLVGTWRACSGNSDPGERKKQRERRISIYRQYEKQTAVKTVLPWDIHHTWAVWSLTSSLLVVYGIHVSIALRVCGGRGWHLCEIIPQRFYIRGGGFPRGGLNCLELQEEASAAGGAGDGPHHALDFAKQLHFAQGFFSGCWVASCVC